MLFAPAQPLQCQTAVVQRPAQQGHLGAVTGDQARRTEEADASSAFVEGATACLCQSLQVFQADVQTGNADDTSILEQRERQGGDQAALTRSVIDVGREQTGFGRRPWAIEPGAEGATVGARRGVSDKRFADSHAADLTVPLRPVCGKAALLVAAKGALAGEDGIATIQCVWLEYQVEAE
ncbi:hypothetical protein D3C85_1165080 [compost metagenome]